MKKAKKRIVVLLAICLIILAGAIVADRILGKSYFKEIKYNKVVEKIKRKESFVLLLSQTTCSHCLQYKPKLEAVANEYQVEVYYIETDLLDSEVRDELKKYFNYTGTPTTIFVINGEEKSAATRINGDASKDKIINKFKSNGFISE